jgi:hypothetical protein
MRLGDLDALIHTHKSEVATIGKDWTVDDLATAIEVAPTIDAIPVEWLEKQASQQGPYSVYCQAAIEILLNDWQKEQEAQDG